MLSLTDLRSRADAKDGVLEPIPPALAPLDPTMPWYAAQTNPRSETKAMHGLSALGWRTYVPFGWRWAKPRHIPSDMHVLRRRPGMPGYVFFLATTDIRGDIRTAEARDIEGVKCVVSQSGRPLKVRPQAIERLMMAERAGVYDHNKEPPRNLKDAFGLVPGDPIRITSGIGEGWIAKVVRRANAREVEVRDDVFGMKIVVPLDRLVPLSADLQDA